MRTALIVLASGLVAATASADAVLTYGFTDLSGRTTPARVRSAQSRRTPPRSPRPAT